MNGHASVVNLVLSNYADVPCVCVTQRVWLWDRSLYQQWYIVYNVYTGSAPTRPTMHWGDESLITTMALCWRQLAWLHTEATGTAAQQWAVKNCLCTYREQRLRVRTRLCLKKSCLSTMVNVGQALLTSALWCQWLTAQFSPTFNSTLSELRHTRQYSLVYCQHLQTINLI